MAVQYVRSCRVMVKLWWRQKRLVGGNSVMACVVAPHIIPNDRQSLVHLPVAREVNSGRDNSARIVRRLGAAVRAIGDRIAPTARGERSCGGAGRHPGGERAL